MDSTTSTDPKVEALRSIGRQRGYSEQEIDARLQQAGLLSAPGLGQQMSHGAGLIGRMAVQGVGNMASIPFGLAGAAYQGVTGREAPAVLQGGQGTAAADQMGLPQPQGAGERTLSAVGEGAISSAVLPGATPGLIGLGGAAGGAGQASAEAGAGPMGQMAASAAVGMGFPVVKMVLSGALQSLLAGTTASRKAAEQSLALLQAGNPEAAASLGQVTQGGIARTLQGGMRNVPGAADVFQGAADAQASQMGGRVNTIAGRMGTIGTKEVAGRALQRGIEEGFMPWFRATAKRLYEKVESIVPASTGVMPTNTTGLVNEYVDKAAAAGPLQEHVTNPAVRSILGKVQEAVDASPDGKIQFGVLKDLRTTLGDMLDGTTIAPDINVREVRRLRDVITADMGAAVQDAGGDAGVAAWKRANLFYSKGMDRIEGVLDPLIRKNTAENAFNSLMSGTRDGATVLRSTMRSLRPTEQNLIRTTVLKNLGKAGAGAQDAAGAVFSPETYLTNWNKLAPEAKTALFDGAPLGVRQDLDKLAAAMDIRKKATNVLPNRSGTAPNVAFFSILAGLSTTLYGAASGNMTAMLSGAAPATAMAATNLAARAFTSPRMINWMVKQTKVPFGAMAQQLALLVKQSQAWPIDDQETARDLSSTLGNVDWNKVLLAHAAADATMRPQ